MKKLPFLTNERLSRLMTSLLMCMGLLLPLMMTFGAGSAMGQAVLTACIALAVFSVLGSLRHGRAVLGVLVVIAALVQFVEIVLKKFIPALHKSLGVYLPLITTNCAVLGVAINNVTDGFNFIESMISSLGVGLGFLLAMVLFAGVRSRIENCPAPNAIKALRWSGRLRISDYRNREPSFSSGSRL